MHSETHEKLPFVLAVTTKEEYPDKLLLKIDQEYLDNLNIEETKQRYFRSFDEYKDRVLVAVRGEEVLITKPESKLRAYVIPTNEELVIARDTKRLVEENL